MAVRASWQGRFYEDTESGMAKVSASESALARATDDMRIHGGYGGYGGYGVAKALLTGRSTIR